MSVLQSKHWKYVQKWDNYSEMDNTKIKNNNRIKPKRKKMAFHLQKSFKPLVNIQIYNVPHSS